MRCRDVREQLRDFEEHRMKPAAEAELRAHLAECADCVRIAEEERAVTALLRTRLPRYTAPADLRARLAATLGAPIPASAAAPAIPSSEPRDLAPSPRPSSFAPPAPAGPAARINRRTGAITIVLALAAAIALFAHRAPEIPESSPLVAESVNDHLRILYAEHPIEIASGGIHQVKPWFAGKLEFAPIVPFGGDDDFPLEGGAVAYFVDRKAAAFFFKRRLHAISLFVFPANGLPWPTSPTLTAGSARAHEATARGFHVLLWREGELGYALVSDVDRAELRTLAARIDP